MFVHDTSDKNVAISYRLDSESVHNGLLCEMNTKRQNVKILNTKDYGYALFLDGRLQSTVKDEYIYHETLVHSLMMYLPEAKNILILGGSEGCVIREVLKWPQVQKVHQVDWDSMLMNLYETTFSEMNNNAYRDKRVKVFAEDAMKFLEECQETYDAVFVDLLDPEESTMEWFQELLELVFQRMHDDSGIIMNVGSVSPLQEGCAEEMALWFRTRREHGYRTALKVHVPSFIQPWCLLMQTPIRNPANWLPDTRYFDKETFKNMIWWSKDYNYALRNFWV